MTEGTQLLVVAVVNVVAAAGFLHQVERLRRAALLPVRARDGRAGRRANSRG